MAATNPISGAKGSFTIPTGQMSFNAATPEAVAFISRWQATVARDIHEVSNFDDADNSKRFVGGLSVMTGTAEGFLDKTNAANFAGMQTQDQAPETGFTLTATTGHTYAFTGIIDSFGMDVTRNGPASFTLSFSSSGEITETGGA